MPYRTMATVQGSIPSNLRFSGYTGRFSKSSNDLRRRIPKLRLIIKIPESGAKGPVLRQAGHALPRPAPQHQPAPSRRLLPNGRDAPRAESSLSTSRELTPQNLRRIQLHTAINSTDPASHSTPPPLQSQSPRKLYKCPFSLLSYFPKSIY